MNETLDGDYQRMAVSDGAYIREHFFGPDPRLRALVEHLTDDDLAKLRRGGHDYRKVYAAYAAAVEHKGAPTVILAKTVKGWTLGPGIEGRNVTHQAKKLTADELKIFRDRLELPIPDDKLKDAPYYHPGPGRARDPVHARAPARARRRRCRSGGGAEAAAGAEGRRRSPSSSPARTGRPARPWRSAAWCATWCATREIGQRIVPIIPDEARTFGMEPLFKEVGIYNPLGQRYTPVDKELLLSYIEKADGQLLEEGITEAGSMGSFQAAGTAYATWGEPMVPFYIFYSMFGFQRTGDQVWAFGDARGRGFMLGATAGRTTLNGEGLQHEDGHSHVLASTVPNILAYDPAFAYELAIIVRDGIDRMYGERGEDVFYYLTLYNENWPQPPKAGGRRGRRPARAVSVQRGDSRPRRVQLLASGPILLQALRAQEMLGREVRRRGRRVERDELPAAPQRGARRRALEPAPPRRRAARAVRARAASTRPGTDHRRHRLHEGACPTWSRAGSTGRSPCSGTDGFGRSDTREALRSHFEVDAEHIAYAALHGAVPRRQVDAGRAQACDRRARDRPGAREPALRLAAGQQRRPQAAQ